MITLKIALEVSISVETALETTLKIALESVDIVEIIETARCRAVAVRGRLLSPRSLRRLPGRPAAVAAD